MPTPVDLDDLDRKILRALSEDARKSYRVIAKALHTSIGTVSARIRRLEAAGVILRYVPILEERSLGYDLAALIGIKISRGKLLEVQRRLARDPRVFGVFDVTGEWDSILMVRFKSVRDLDTFVKKLLATENVERTYTQVVLNVVKHEARIPV